MRSPGIDKLARLFVRVGDARGDVHHGRTDGGDAGEERPRLGDFPGERGEETLVRVRHRVVASRSADRSTLRDAFVCVDDGRRRKRRSDRPTTTTVVVATGAMSDGANGDAPPYDHLVKLLLVGDSGVGKSSLLMRFVADKFEEVSPTIGVDFKLKYVDVHGKKLKLTVWDTAGQERFRTLTSSYYRGAQGVIFVYDITSEETFENLRDVWRKEVELYSTIENAVKIVIGNKVDKEADRAISREKGVAFAKEFGCLFLECSAKTNRSVQEAFDELVKGILEAPGLLSELGTDDPAVKLGAYGESTSGCC